VRKNDDFPLILAIRVFLNSWHLVRLCAPTFSHAPAFLPGVPRGNPARPCCRPRQRGLNQCAILFRVPVMARCMSGPTGGPGRSTPPADRGQGVGSPSASAPCFWSASALTGAARHRRARGAGASLLRCDDPAGVPPALGHALASRHDLAGAARSRPGEIGEHHREMAALAGGFG
jgi:hypothetical protein